jgi:hypothetical protein
LAKDPIRPGRLQSPIKQAGRKNALFSQLYIETGPRKHAIQQTFFL